MANVPIRIKGKTAATWTSENPVLLARQPGFETDTRKMKFGDGATAWNALPYATGNAVWGEITGDIDDQTDLTAYVNMLIAAYVAAENAMVFKGVIDCSTNPNYPAADAGHTYRVSVAGKIGGASGINVEAGDMVMCNSDGTASGTQAAVGASWNITQLNLDGAVIGPASSTASNFALFDGNTGKLLKDTGKKMYNDTTFTSPTANDIPDALTLKTYIEGGAGNGIMNVPLHSDATATWTYTNQPSTPNRYGGTDRHVVKVDTRKFRWIRLQLQVITASTSANTPHCYAEYSTDGSSYTKIGSGGGTEIISLASTGKKNTSWITIPAGMVDSDVYIAIGCTGGDAAADPAIMSVHIQFM